MKIPQFIPNRLDPSIRLPGRAGRAFTIIELIVAMGITILMVLLINRIFFDTTNAVSRGIGLSQIVGESRSMSSVLDSDLIADNILKPGNGGFLFIGFKQYQDIPFTNARSIGSETRQNVQSDQLLLALDISGQGRTSLTPASTNTSSSYTPSVSNALLWYGHVARLNVNGTNAGKLDADVANASGPNRLGNRWILGRQLSFLDDSGTPTIYANGAFADSTITGYPPTLPSTQTNFNYRYTALSDIVDLNLAGITGPNPSLFDPAIAFTNTTQYLAQAARMAYTTYRLRTSQSVYTTDTNPVDDSFPSWSIAQTHTALLDNCSDFEITFAGDFDATAGMDVDSGNIKWYGGNPQTVSDPGYDPSRGTIYDAATVTSVAVTNPPDYSESKNALPGGIAEEVRNLADPSGPIPTLNIDSGIVFRHDSTDIGADGKYHGWPYLIRIRYRLHDQKGEYESSIRYTDSSSVERDKRIQGVWFERIIQIQ